MRPHPFGWYLLDENQSFRCVLVNHNKIVYRLGDESFKLLPYQLWTVRYRLTVTFTGNGELGFDSGEGA